MQAKPIKILVPTDFSRNPSLHGGRRLKNDRIVEDHAKILDRHRSIGNVVSIAETQPPIPQRTGGDAVVYGCVYLFFPAASGEAAVGIGTKRSNSG